ncbi:hypothetical protein NE237_029388 [Protea cynaroides]|uniref:Fungal lipase-type domain-containing protein n=1 Tax=Protea cynaroides TaxID=273540 RepID=A0A9Q0GT18_9MAGN|nr:hypothetical protein NE237_029388 [Protea cynaroides]
MASEREIFSVSGPLHLTTVDWANADHRRSVAASLVQGVYILERDRQQKRKGPESLAPPWFEFFHFQLLHQLMDDVDFSIFGAIYEFRPPPFNYHHSIQFAPRYVIAFRGTITKPDSVSQDLKLDLLVVQNGLHGTSRYEIGMQAVRNMVAAAGAWNIWLAGHSLGSSMAMLAGKNMAKTGVFLQAFLFNPPFLSAPIEKIKDKNLKHGIRMANSFITAGLAIARKGHSQKSASEDPFVILSAWVPCLFVNPADHICSEYIGYFEHRKKMEKIGASGIEKLATQNSIVGLLLGKKESEPLHLLPSASLTINLSPSADFKQAHGIHQWWNPDLHLQCNLYQYR